MSIVNLLKTIHKLKAAIIVLIGDNEQLINQAKSVYYNNIIIEETFNENDNFN